MSAKGDGGGVKRKKKRQISHACLEWEVKESKLHLSFPSFPASSLSSPSTALFFPSKHCAIRCLEMEIAWPHVWRGCDSIKGDIDWAKDVSAGTASWFKALRKARLWGWSVWWLTALPPAVSIIFLQIRAKPPVANPRDVLFARHFFFATVENICNAMMLCLSNDIYHLFEK